MDIRDKIITGSFAIGSDGRKEPIDWKDYSLKLEKELTEKDNLLKEHREALYNAYYHIKNPSLQATKQELLLIEQTLKETE